MKTKQLIMGMLFSLITTYALAAPATLDQIKDVLLKNVNITSDEQSMYDSNRDGKIDIADVIFRTTLSNISLDVGEYTGMMQSSVENQFDGEDLILVGADKKIVFNTSKNPGIAWTEYDVILREDAGWRYNDVNGEAVSRSDFKKILRDLSAIYIRGEYVTGEDTGGLDSVVLDSSRSKSKP